MAFTIISMKNKWYAFGQIRVLNEHQFATIIKHEMQRYAKYVDIKAQGLRVSGGS